MFLSFTRDHMTPPAHQYATVSAECPEDEERDEEVEASCELMLASLEELLAPEDEEEDGGGEGGDRKKRHARGGRGGHRRGRGHRGRGRRGRGCKLPLHLLGMIEEASKEQIKMGVS